ncbi:MAG: hypothetical protein RM022_004660 [Nostoc sp. EfeVER01]|uniref:hypothetical protein n=1 Tax=unclassified Nostoc TaxID=2593658 RepID=UPI002AD4588F|nr:MULTISPECIES: hypothetical protein [unclassified Nostoc]MDZ7944452.1 hypothetical protein [Nostoc sp. EfeVER01]MDZ7991896.1 hypothetical protein [Nostoc sp. EspVER01]
MFTRTELEVKSLRALRDLCLIQYGIQAIRNPADKASYINALLTFPVVACKQVAENKGLKSPIFSKVEALEAMGTPTPEQSALLKVTMEGRKLEYPARYSQEKLFGLYRVKWYLDTALEILGIL